MPFACRHCTRGDPYASHPVPHPSPTPPPRPARLTTTLEAEIAQHRLPRFVLAIARHHRLAYFETRGELDPATHAPMPADVIFSIASMTKPLTAVAALTLLEEGRLSLTDPVAQYLPRLANSQVAPDHALPTTIEPVHRPITG